MPSLQLGAQSRKPKNSPESTFLIHAHSGNVSHGRIPLFGCLFSAPTSNEHFMPKGLTGLSLWGTIAKFAPVCSASS